MGLREAQALSQRPMGTSKQPFIQSDTRTGPSDTRSGTLIFDVDCDGQLTIDELHQMVMETAKARLHVAVERRASPELRRGEAWVVAVQIDRGLLAPPFLGGTGARWPAE